MLHISLQLAASPYSKISFKTYELELESKSDEIIEFFYKSNVNLKESVDNAMHGIVEAVSYIKNMFYRVKTYLKSKQLHSMVPSLHRIDNITFPENSTLSTSLTTLHKTIMINVVLGQYAKCVRAVNQTLYPYGDDQLYGYSFIVGENFYEANVNLGFIKVVDIILTDIEALRNLLNTNNENRMHATFSSNYISSKPFYVWDRRDHSKAISDLLSGK